MTQLEKTNLIAQMEDGILIYEGIWEETMGPRDVLVKCFPHKLKSLAVIEQEAYLDHRNSPYIPRFYGMTEDAEYTNIILEAPVCNLHELIESCKDCVPIVNEGKRAIFLKKVIDRIPLWNDAKPSLILLKILRDIIKAVRYLELNQVMHRNLMPENIWIFEEPWHSGMHAKLTNFSSCYSTLHPGMHGSGTTGWRSPEQIKKEPETIKLDGFALGLIACYCIAQGKHAYGNILNAKECEDGIRKNSLAVSGFNITLTERDFITRLLQPVSTRPLSSSTLSHPIFWKYTKQLNFIVAFSNKIRGLKDTSQEMMDFESRRKTVLKEDLWDPWTSDMKSDFVNFINDPQPPVPYYNTKKLKDMVRLVRNVIHHNDSYEKYVGSSMKQVYDYFERWYPGLFILVYNFVKYGRWNWKDEEPFKTYLADCPYGES